MGKILTTSIYIFFEIRNNRKCALYKSWVKKWNGAATTTAAAGAQHTSSKAGDVLAHGKGYYAHMR